jgi:hypothetical protein
MVHVWAKDNGEYEPAGQSGQLLLPSEKVPGWHSLQSPKLSWRVMVAPSSSIFKPAGQVEHVPVPGNEAYESAAHTEHGPSAEAEKVPSGQRPQETHDPPCASATWAAVLVPSEPGPHEQVKVPP